MTKITITLDGKPCEVESGSTLLQACRQQGVFLPTLCQLEGITNVGACRICLVEVEGVNRLLPACTTAVAPNQKVHTDTDRLRRNRRLVMELFFSEGNHICSVCVANRKCELQKMAVAVGMDHVRFPYLYPKYEVDMSHKDFIMDPNRCIRCTRCVRVCDEVEGAHNWDVQGRGIQARIISDFFQPWGESTTCTSCGKCVLACPTGTLWFKDGVQGQVKKDPGLITELVAKRKVQS